MGQNLSSKIVPDTSGVVLSPQDRSADIMLALFWVGVLYGCAMIFSTCALVDRWKGPRDTIHVGGGAVMLAFLLSTVWPVVLAYLSFSKF